MFFSGFCFHHEEVLFKRFLPKGIYDLSGFSYGAQKAFDEAYRRICEGKRVQRLALFSPAFFEDKTQAYKRLQILAFNRDSDSYIQAFLHSIGLSQGMQKYIQKGEISELEALLYYVWDKKKLEKIKDKGIKLEVYLGGEDEIINPLAARDFFAPYGVVYFIKSSNHLLTPI
ncbi:pimelyl-ACP methyl ester esterase BioV [Helicobacter sp. 11S03491-1]|uniref:pimelyl-ACP methyl ester esterase BioV n=1 Tax=Helicobacter sp. 11S03491-1 TaxID=1476196 RepID=UPI000BA6F280|nr:pimelyl-ACP methyl ester esterase BioV [Helicobacter sp. 11S03491-1]PAF41679.1 hypothetical protein BKH45_06195 [Helicobacter sp. 11S03491-1]